jgi:hypothetical protein
MVLQKALSQHYNGFFEPAKIPVNHLLETLTGSEVYTIKLPNTKPNTKPNDNGAPSEDQLAIRNKLQQLLTESTMLVLNPCPDCPLK